MSGTLAGHQTLIRSEVRRVQAENGTWVRHHTVSLPVRLGEGAQAGDREHLQALVQQALDEHVNDRFALPRSGDQLHVAVEFRDAPKDSEQVTVSRGDHSKPMDQRNWTLDSREHDSRYAAKLVHEVFHYLGARDEEHDTDFVFRRSRESAAVHDVGLMADADDFTPILNRHLAVIEDTTDVTAMVRDHPLTVDRTAVRNPEPAPEPRTHPDASDGDDERWSAARAPRGALRPTRAASTRMCRGTPVPGRPNPASGRRVRRRISREAVRQGAATGRAERGPHRWRKAPGRYRLPIVRHGGGMILSTVNSGRQIIGVAGRTPAEFDTGMQMSSSQYSNED